MEESSISEEKLKSLYLNLRKYSQEVEFYYNKWSQEEFSENFWKKKGNQIQNKIKAYKEVTAEIKTILSKDNIKVDDAVINVIKENLEKIEENLEPKIKKLDKEIKNIEILNECVEEKDLKKSKEYLDAKNEEIGKIKKAYELILKADEIIKINQNEINNEKKQEEEGKNNNLPLYKEEPAKTIPKEQKKEKKKKKACIIF